MKEVKLCKPDCLSQLSYVYLKLVMTVYSYRKHHHLYFTLLPEFTPIWQLLTYSSFLGVVQWGTEAASKIHYVMCHDYSFFLFFFLKKIMIPCFNNALSTNCGTILKQHYYNIGLCTCFSATRCNEFVPRTINEEQFYLFPFLCLLGTHSAFLISLCFGKWLLQLSTFSYTSGFDLIILHR